MNSSLVLHEELMRRARTILPRVGGGVGVGGGWGNARLSFIAYLRRACGKRTAAVAEHQGMNESKIIKGGATCR